MESTQPLEYSDLGSHSRDSLVIITRAVIIQIKMVGNLVYLLVTLLVAWCAAAEDQACIPHVMEVRYKYKTLYIIFAIAC
jgi:hypothetical protein